MSQTIHSGGVSLAARLREVREAQGISQERAAAAIGASQATYSRIEDGTRALKGDELILLADFFDTRAAALTGLAEVRARARFAARVDGESSRGFRLRDRLYAYLELDAYLRDAGIPDDAPARGTPRVAVASNEAQGKALANEFRRRHHLGAAPIGDIFESVHRSTGIDVLSIPADEYEHGFSVLDPDSGTIAIAVATTRHPFRQRSSVAHELGHVVSGDLDRSGSFTPGSRSDEEIRADAFARHLLLPQDVLLGRFDTSGEVTVPDLSVIVQEFGVSPTMAAIQLREAGYLTSAVCRELCTFTAAQLAFLNGWHSHYVALAKEAEVPRAPQGLVTRLIRSYRSGVLGLSELADWSGRPASEVSLELGDPDSREPAWDDFWGSDEPLFPKAIDE